MVRATFVLEQHLGHQTYAENLRHFISHDSALKATWAPVTYSEPAGYIERLPFVSAGLRGTLRGRMQVRRALAHGPADVVFFNTQVPAVLGGALARRRPYLIATDITPAQYDKLSHLYNHKPDRPGPLKLYKHYVNSNIFRGAARLLPWSNWTRQSLIADYGVRPEQIEVVPPGVDLRRWVPGPQRTEGPLRILFVGGDFYRKGGQTLLQAFRTLPIGAAELHIVTRTRIQPEEGVRLYHSMQPNSAELIALYQASDVFVLPTQAEAFGIAAAEACAAGLASIVTDVGGITDIVVEGENGFQVKPGDVKALSGRLQALISDVEQRLRMGRAARARAEARFDARRNAARIAEYTRAAAEGLAAQPGIIAR